jgi:prepilin peptidase CpaA
MNILVWISLIVGCAAIAEDLYRRRISNWTSAAAVLGGLLFHIGRDGWKGLATSLLGAATGFGVFLLFYLLQGMGGGDLKLMAGFGSLLGPGLVVHAAFFTAVFGGLMAAAWLTVNWARRTLARSSGSTVARARTIPYAPAIAFGCWLVLLTKS